VSHDDDPRRAVSAALEISLARLLNEEVGPRLPDCCPSTGLNTGLLVTQRRDDAKGPSVRVTHQHRLRLKSIAQPDEIVIGRHTSCVENFFVTERLARRAQGKARPIELYRVLRPAAHDWLRATRRGLSLYRCGARARGLDEW